MIDLTAAQRELLQALLDNEEDGGHPLHTGFSQPRIEDWPADVRGLVDVDLCSCDRSTAYILTDAGREAIRAVQQREVG